MNACCYYKVFVFGYMSCCADHTTLNPLNNRKIDITAINTKR